MPQRGEFRATTDQMLQIIDEFRATEAAKQHVGIGSDEFVKLAKQAEDLSRLAYRWAGMQLSMALDTRDRIARGEFADDTPLIEVVPRPLDRVLADWREAQFRLEIAALGSPEAEAATGDIERLRVEYQAGHDTKVHGPSGSLANPEFEPDGA